jgi:Domain of unknown function (DUF1906)
MTAVDFSFARPTIAQLRAADVTLVIRYLTGSGKAIDLPELTSYLSNGIEVAFVFEVGATDAQGDETAGIEYASQARSAMSKLGVSDCPIYFAVDQDITPSAAVPYFQGINTILPASLVGVYGEGALCQLLDTDGLAEWFWQSESTSFPGNFNALSITHLWQKYNASPIAGTDLDEILKADVGQWPRPTPPAPAPVPVPTDYPGDNVKSYPITCEISNGEGWTPLPAGVTAAQVITVTTVDLDPPSIGGYADVPALAGVTGDGHLVFGPGAGGVGAKMNGNYSFTLWVAG